MLKVFLDDVKKLPVDFCLSMGFKSHVKQAANVMIKFEKFLLDQN